MMENQKNARQIAIVGAGPAGLVAAIAAHKLGFSVKVFEQAADFTKVGGGIMIQSNGQRVLATLGVLESFRPQMVAVTRGVIEGERGKILTEIDFTEIDVPHNRVAVVWRYQLQEHLLKASQDLGIEVNFKHRLNNLDFVGEQVVLKFENAVNVAADIVIAADGVNSRTREASKIEFEKIPINEAWIRGASEVHLSNSAFREIWGNDGRRFGIAPLTEDKTYFYARVPLGEWETIRDNRLEEWIESWREFGEDAIKILRSVKDWQKINYSELYEIRAQNWVKPPIFLIGDSVHAMTPNTGQGANSAMVDALILMRMLKQAEKDKSYLADVGQRYTNLRRPFVTKIQNAARQSGELAAKTSTIAHLTRNLIFAASRNLGALRRQNLLITAGYNPAENEYFDSLDDD